MFILNFKLNKNLLSKTFFTLMIIIILIIFIIGIYLIFIKPNNSFTISDSIKSEEIFQITNNNYATILNASNKDIDSYIGCKVQITGYIYRLIDFKDNQFVIARDMLLPNNSQTLIIGFLCEYDNSTDFADGQWVNLIGEIKKGDFNGEIPILNILEINVTDIPEDIYVLPPDNTYIPTINMF